MNDEPPIAAHGTEALTTGIVGLDKILYGGFPARRLHLIEGTPGAGKTTLALGFLLEGARCGESGLYVTLSETANELKAVARSHGWSLGGIDIFELVTEDGFSSANEQTLLHPSEIELSETVRGVIAEVEKNNPVRVVLDSLSELRLLSQNPLRYRRQILALKHFFAKRHCTVLMLDDRTAETGDLQLHSIAHGVVSLEQSLNDFGSERRRLRVRKMRGLKYRGGYHDFRIEKGGLCVYPRLVASEHHTQFDATPVTTGVPELDALFGAGLTPGTTTLLSGPAGVGKTTTAVQCMLAALERGERVVSYLFDERLNTLLARSAALGNDLQPYVDNGQLTLRQIDPAELSPGEFAGLVQEAVEEDAANMVVIDSINGYMQSMPSDNFLVLQMHELLSYLSQQGVVTLMILGQHGITGDLRSEVDLSYLSDSLLLMRYFEARGVVKKSMAVIKTRTQEHERTIREFAIGPGGIKVGEPLTDFEHILSGNPRYAKAGTDLMAED